MIIEVYLLIQIIVIVGLFLVFNTKNVLASVITLVLSGILIAGSWLITIGTEYIWDSSLRAYVPSLITIQTTFLPYMNMIIFGLALLYFISDLIEIIQEESPKINNTTPRD